jgi:hypothetical protein
MIVNSYHTSLLISDAQKVRFNLQEVVAKVTKYHGFYA